MKIKIKMKESSSIALEAILKNITNVTNVQIFDYGATCDIPQEPVFPGGRMGDIYNILGGINTVKSITLIKR